MTDKEKLEAVRAEIHRLVDVRGYDREMANDLFAFMDSLPNEPVSEVWHDAQTEQPQAKEKILATNEYGDCEIDFAINMALYWPKVIKWAYIDDIINITNKEEPVSEELEEDINKEWRCYSKDNNVAYINKFSFILIARHFTNWQKEKEYTCYEEAFEDGATWKVENLWKPADGDDLPEYDREVIVLTQPYPLEGSEFAVSFAHRPDPKGWDGKSITTGKVEHYTPKTYDKGGWNIPNVKCWLDCLMPKEIEL